MEREQTQGKEEGWPAASRAHLSAPLAPAVRGEKRSVRDGVGESGREKQTASLNTCSDACMHAKSLQSCLTLCNPMDCSQPGSSVHGILPARILEWVAMPSSRESSQLRD